MSTTTTPVTNINFSSESPAAPTGQQNIVWSDDSSGDISGYLPAFEGDSGSGGLAGAVPAPAAGAAAAGKFLRADGTWAAPSGSGVTSVGVSVPSVLTVSGTPVTTSGTIALGLATQSPNLVLAGPVSGTVGATPTFRSLVAADLPAGLGGSSIAMETNGTANASQTKLNLVAGANVTLTPDSTGDVTTETIAPLGTATSSSNFSSSPLTLDASYWTGSAAATDSWTMQGAVGAGSNPSSTLSISHSGSSGSSTVSVPQLYAPTINSTTINATTLNTTSVAASGAVAAASFSASGDITTATSSTGTLTVSGGLSSSTGTFSGNVGLGTSSPIAPFQVVTQSDTESGGGSFGTASSIPQASILAGGAGVDQAILAASVNQGTNTGFLSALKPGIAWGTLVLQAFGGSITMGAPGSPTVVTVNGTLTATTKNFTIPYPGSPAELLVHSCLEGPEVGVYYRGTAQLVDGVATIALPAYFEALTLASGRTVLLTPQFQTATDAISQLAASLVANGQFTVRASDTNNPSQMFCWEVKAVRSDVPALEVVVPAPTTTTTPTSAATTTTPSA